MEEVDVEQPYLYKLKNEALDLILENIWECFCVYCKVVYCIETSINKEDVVPFVRTIASYLIDLQFQSYPLVISLEKIKENEKKSRPASISSTKRGLMQELCILGSSWA